MRFSFNTFNHSTYYGLAPSLPAQVRAAAAAGYDFVGLDLLSVLAHEREGLPVPAIAEVLGECELPCYELVSLSVSADRDATRRSLDHILRVAAVLRPHEVLCVVTGAPDSAVAANLAECAAALAAESLGLSLEFLPTRDVDSINVAAELLDRVAHPNLRLVVESWHFFRGPSIWEDLDALPVERFGFVQFADAPDPVSDDIHHESMHRRVLPGEGVFDLRRFCDTVGAKGYDGVVSMEVLSEQWRDADLTKFARATLVAGRELWTPTDRACA